ncbi:MAG: HAD family hydrolase [Candidatus Dormibacteria bacterium]
MTHITALAVLFDMDGILIDTEPLWDAAERKVAHDLGFALPDAMLDATRGVRIHEVVQKWQHTYPDHTMPLETTCSRITSAVAETIRIAGVPREGVLSFLEDLHRAGIPCALASSSPRLLIDTVLDSLGITDFFQEIVSGDDVHNGKPDPEIYLRAASRIGKPPSSCVAIEDALAGMKAARRAGAYCIAIPDPSIANSGELSEATHVCSSISRLANHCSYHPLLTIDCTPHPNTP